MLSETRVAQPTEYGAMVFTDASDVGLGVVITTS